MERYNFTQQMISFQRTFFENTFQAVSTLQDQTEKIAVGFCAQMPWIPGDTMRMVTDTMNFYRNSREDFKKAIDKGFAILDDCFVRK